MFPTNFGQSWMEPAMYRHMIKSYFFPSIQGLSTSSISNLTFGGTLRRRVSKEWLHQEQEVHAPGWLDCAQVVSDNLLIF